jgi:glucose uptake protein GlcU
LLSRLTLIVIAALACANAGYGQAAVEYALKSSGSAVSASGAPATIGGCLVDAKLLTCLNHSYPKTTVIVIGLVALMVIRQLTRVHAARS